jgi:hypothetical protein
MKKRTQVWLPTLFILLVACGLTNAQTPQTNVATNKDSESPAELIEATEQYKASSGELLSIQEGEVKKAELALEELRVLVGQGLVARAELETSEQALAGLRSQLEVTRKQIADSEHKITEIRQEQQIAKTQAAALAKSPVKLVSKQYGTLSATGTILRYSGAAPFFLGGLAGIQSFFSSTFGRPLPTSAVGQSATHNRLGYNHRNAVDVALHPDTPEGKALIAYLQGQGIPFLAFRAAVPGVATGPHIHIGSPSSRL